MEYSYNYIQSQKSNQKLTAILEKLPFFCAEFISEKRTERKDFKIETGYMYLSSIHQFFNYLGNELNISTVDITPEMLNEVSVEKLENFLARPIPAKNNENHTENEQKYSIAAKKRTLSAIRSLYSYLLKQKKLSYNPAALIHYKNDNSTSLMVTMSDMQRISLLHNMEQGKCVSKSGRSRQVSKNNKLLIRDIAILFLLLGTGITIDELVALNVDDVDLTDDYIVIMDRNNKIKKLSFSSEVHDKLSNYIYDIRPLFVEPDNDSKFNQPLFVSTHKKRITSRNIHYMLEKYTTSAFPDDTEHITPKNLRYAYAASLYHLTGDALLVTETLGLKDASFIKRLTNTKQNKIVRVPVIPS